MRPSTRSLWCWGCCGLRGADSELSHWRNVTQHRSGEFVYSPDAGVAVLSGGGRWSARAHWRGRSIILIGSIAGAWKVGLIEALILCCIEWGWYIYIFSLVWDSKKRVSTCYCTNHAELAFAFGIGCIFYVCNDLHWSIWSGSYSGAIYSRSEAGLRIAVSDFLSFSPSVSHFPSSFSSSPFLFSSTFSLVTPPLTPTSTTWAKPWICSLTRKERGKKEKRKLRFLPHRPKMIRHFLTNHNYWGLKQNKTNKKSQLAWLWVLCSWKGVVMTWQLQSLV